MNSLNLTIKGKWFDMILSGEKAEEYREIKDYWARRLLGSRESIEFQVWDEMLSDMKNPFRRHKDVADLMKYFGVYFREYTQVKFRNGYGADSPCFEVALDRIEIAQGREEWGAEKGVYYFVLRLRGNRT